MTHELKPGDKVLVASHYWAMENWKVGRLTKVTPQRVRWTEDDGWRDSLLDKSNVRAVLPPDTNLEHLRGFIKASAMDRDAKISAARVQHTQDVFEFAKATKV